MASPLYDLYDPYGIIKRRAERTGDKRYTISDLMPEDEKRSMLRSLSEVGGSGLSALGWILDTPGAFIRSLAAVPVRGLSALSPTAERISGRDLLRDYGMVKDEDGWGNFAGGLVAEIALDPGTWLTLGASQLLGRGAKTAAAEIASKRGLWQHLDAAAAQAGMGPREFARNKTINELVAAIPDSARKHTQSGLQQNLGGVLLEDAMEVARKSGLTGAEAQQHAVDLLNKAKLTKSNAWSIPGYGHGAFDLYGQRAGDAMAKFGDMAGDYLSKAPVLKRLPPLFETGVMGMMNPERWSDAKRLSADKTLGVPALTRPLMEKVFDATEFIKTLGLDENDAALLKRHLSNQLAGHNYTRFASAADEQRFADYFTRDVGGGNYVPTPLGELVGYWNQVGPQYVQELKNAGLPVSEFQPQSQIGQFFPAQKAFFDKAVEPLWPANAPARPNRGAGRMRGEQVAQVADIATMPRQPYLDIPAREELLAAMTTDSALQDALRAAKNSEAPQILEKWFETNYPDVYVDAARANRGTLGTVDRPGLFGWTDRPGARRAPQLGETHPLAIRRTKLKKEISDLLAQAQAANARGMPTTQVMQKVKQLRGALVQVRQKIRDTSKEEWRKDLYSKLADTLRYTDPQHAANNVPLFGVDPLNALVNYGRNRAEMLVNAEFITNLLARSAKDTPASEVAGGLAYSLHDAAKMLGFDPVGIEGPLAAAIGRVRTGASPAAKALQGMSVDKALVDDWARRINPSQTSSALQPALDAFDEYTQAFKTGSLLFPSRYTRDLYSGGMASATQGLLSKESRDIGSAIRRGDYSKLGVALDRLTGPEWRGLSTQDRVKKFLVDMATQGVATGTERDVLRGTPSAARRRSFYPGANASDKTRSWTGGVNFGDLFTWAKVAPPAVGNESLIGRLARGSLWSQNPLVEYGDQWAEYTDAANRFGAYTEAVLQGNSPAEAKRLADLTQVNYAPEAFTDFERTYMRRLFPFYSYTRGITPLVVENLLAGPKAVRRHARTGLPGLGINPQNLAIRTLSRASEPSEDNFTPEHLRQSASIPIAKGLAFLGLPEDSPLQRYLTNIDLPFQAPLDIFSIGSGNNAYEVGANTIKQTAMNILGQSHPLPKTLLEMAANRQFYSGRQLSDLYSMLEQQLGTPGRSVEQVITGMVPFGSRAIGMTRQLVDDRLTGAEKALKFLVNTGSGLKFQDVDEERTRQFAARDTLNDLLTSSPNVRTYENIVVKEEDLEKLSPQQRRLYLLYKVLQAEAAKKARDRKKEQAQSLLSR
ncbi:MAG: hypothetical protein EBT03_07255 [Betaproteobacteria bacterium]|nr:hypothetical protein [Betaproteobacteria bacterium]NCA16849.1 hypothetical protein [Betaproteobacteria bacterium]